MVYGGAQEIEFAMDLHIIICSEVQQTHVLSFSVSKA